jgi:hypothetical protein
VESKMLADLTVNLVTAVCVLLIGVSQFSLSYVHVADLIKYPYYLYEYFYRMARVPLMFHLLVVIMYVRNPEMRKTVGREARIQITNAFHDLRHC